jgi:PAS domain S-box-containing protein
MDALSSGTPAGHALGASDTATPTPPPAHYAVLDSGGVIVAADDRWAAAARDPSSTVGALGSVGARYHDALEAEARRRPELRDPLLRLATAVRDTLAGQGETTFAFTVAERTHAARVIPVRGAGEDRTVVTLVDTTGHLGSAGTQELRRRFESLVDSLELGIVLQDPDGRALASNPSAQRILGLSAGQLAGTAPIDARWALLHEDGWPLPPEERPSRLALRNRAPVRDALVGVKRPGGHVTWTSVSAHPLIHEGEERPYAVVVSIADVTDSRAAGDAERRSHDRFRSLIEHSSDVVTIVDDRGRVTYESPAVEAVLGYAPGELVGPGRLARAHPDDVAAAVGAVTGLIGRPGESVSCEYRIKARDGRWRVLESVATNRLHDPAVLGIVINTRDVTERRETEAALRATTLRLENLVQNLQAGVLVEDADRRIAVVNSDLCRTFAIDAQPRALLGADCVEAASAAAALMAEPERFVERIEQVIAAGEPVQGEELAFADGRTFERDYIPISSGRLDRSHLWIYRDISSRKDDEREAARIRDEAIRASRLKSEFLATMSHEIRTPMQGVIATVELLLDTELEPHQRDLAALVRDSTYGLLAVVDDALDLSKLEASKLEPREVELDVAAVTEGVGDVVLSAARRKGLALTVYVDPRIPPCLLGDSQWLRQVLVNIAGNAVKFTDQGDIRIRAELAAGGSGSATVRFAVTDTGIGIPASTHERLFDPFFQLEPIGGRRPGGTGLGLAICRRLVGLMGGELEVESEPGRGSTFSFALTLPIAGGAIRPLRGHRGGARQLRVLIAEPRKAIAEIATDYLGAWGIEAERAVSAAGARERAAAAARAGRPFDVAIVGVGPPERAAEVAAELRAIDGCGAIRLVRLQDVGAPAVEREGLFDRELTRPLKQARLYEAVVGPAEAPAHAPPDAVKQTAELPAGLRVLVAEDNEVNRELLVRQLAKLGVSGEAVASGADAVEAAIAGSYDAVLMDLHMPEVDGLQAARAIRAIPGDRGGVPIVAVTGGGTPGERGACLAAGMDDVVLKPVTSRDLAQALRRVLPPPGRALPAIDPAAIERLDSDLGDSAELRRIAGIFLAQLGPGAQAIAAAAEAGRDDDLRRAAHRLGSASATFGAARVADLCRRLEAPGASARGEESAELARSLDAESAIAAAELRGLLSLA